MSNSTIYYPHGRVTHYYTGKARKSNPYIRPIVFVFVLVISVLGIMKLRSMSNKPDETKVVDATQNHTPATTPSPTTPPPPRDITELIQKVAKITKENEGMYSVRFEDFKQTASFGIKDEVVVDAASVNKIPILAAVYYLANRGELDLDKEISIPVKDVQDYGTGSIRYEKQPIVHTIRDLSRLMMKVSDNTAAFVLASRMIGLSNVQKIVNDLGLTHTDMDENTTTNRDQATLLRVIFEGKVANPTLTKEMLGWMHDTEFEDRLPSQIPEEVIVYHKIGNQVHVIHDVGVIEFDNKRYYLGVLTTDIPDEEGTKKVIGEISKVVYEFMKGD